MAGSLRQFNEQFVGNLNKKAMANIMKELKQDPESAAKMVDSQIEVETGLIKTMGDLTRAQETHVENFNKQKTGIALKKKNPEELKKLEALHEEILAAGKHVIDDYKKAGTSSTKRIDQLQKSKEEAKQLNMLMASKKSSTNTLLRKKT